MSLNAATKVQSSAVIEGIAFDLGSTLLHLKGDMQRVLAHSRKVLFDYLVSTGLALDEEIFLARFHQAQRQAHQARQKDHRERRTADLLQVLMQSFGHPPLSAEQLEQALRQYYAVSEGTWQPVEGNRQVLAQLADKGYRLALISNAGDAKNVDRLLQKVQLMHWFDPILVSASLTARKPQAEIFQRLLDTWRLPASSIIMIGDSLSEDILGAQGVGMHTIWVKQYAQETLSQVAHQPDCVADRLSQVPQCVESLAHGLISA